MLNKKWLAMFCVGTMLLMGVVGCGSKKQNFSDLKLKDGQYKGHYEDEDDDSSAASIVDVTLTIKNGHIVDCTNTERIKSSGEVKGETYGLNTGEQTYKLAQRAVQGQALYPNKLIEVQDPDQLDSISGATVSHKRFKEAVWDALKKAQ